MKFYKRLIGCSLLACSLLTSCGGSTEKPNTGGETMEFIDTKIESFNLFDATHVRYLGRHTKKQIDGKDSMYFGFTCSGFELFLDVKSEENEIKTQLYSELLGDNKTQYLGVYIDNEFREKIEVTPGNHEITLATNISKGKHTLKFLKLNEASVSKIGIFSLNISEGIDIYSRKYNKKRPLIEFYGDSITTGYGNLGTPESKTFKTIEQDGTQTYGYLTASELDFDSSFVACSGIALTPSLAPYGVHMMDQYNTVEGEIPFDMSTNQPDFVVINLGSNDYAKFEELNDKEIEEGLEDFKRDYKIIIEEILKYSPNTKFISCYDMCYTIATGLKKAIREASKEINEKYGENTAIYKQFLNNQSGANGHPSVIAHKTAAGTLTKLIKETYLINSEE